MLRELQSHLQETGQRPEDAFGSPQEYAARFPQGNTVSRGSKVAYGAAAVLMVIITVKVFTSQVLGMSLGFPGIFIYPGATALLAFALIAWSKALGRKLQKGLRNSPAGSGGTALCPEYMYRRRRACRPRRTSPERSFFAQTAGRLDLCTRRTLQMMMPTASARDPPLVRITPPRVSGALLLELRQVGVVQGPGGVLRGG